MLIKKLREQWICSCGNWVDQELQWCPDCCEEKLTETYGTKKDQGRAEIAT